MESTKKQLLHLISVGHLVESSELIDIYEKRGYNAMSIRNMLSHLKKLKLIDNEERGVYKITQSGQQYINVLNNKYIPASDFDNTFYFILLNIPEIQRKEKDSFKIVLSQYGFGPYLSNVYISPNDNCDEIKKVAHNMGLTSYISIISGTLTSPGLNDALIRKIWNLDAVEILYAKINDFLKEIQTRKNINDDTELFNLYLDTGSLISDIFIIDPFLPVELLPSNWQYQQTLHGIFSVYEKFADRLRQSKFNKFIE